MKKILYVCNGSGLYGSEQALINLLDNLSKDEYEPTVLIPKKGIIIKELESRNIKYKIIRYYSWSIRKKNVFYYMLFFIKHLINLTSLIRLKKYFDIEKFDLIHSLNSSVYFGSLIADRYNVNHVWHLREYNLKYASIKYLRKQFSRSLKLICISNSVFDFFNDLVPQKQYIIIKDGIDTKQYLNLDIPYCNKKDFNFLIAGDIIRNKGQYIAIKAIEHLVKQKKYNLKLYIAGDGKDEKKLKDYIKENSLEEYIFFIGFRNDLNEIRKKINIYLMCSLKEGWGYVTIESILSKNLVIGSKSGGTSEIIKNGENGLLFEPGSINSLISTIEYAIINWDKCIKIINNGYKNAITDFSIDKTSKQIKKIYDSIFEKNI